MAQELAEKWASSFEEILALNPRTRRITQSRVHRTEPSIEHVDYSYYDSNILFVNASTVGATRGRFGTSPFSFVRIKHPCPPSTFDRDVFNGCLFSEIAEAIEIVIMRIGRQFYFNYSIPTCECNLEIGCCGCEPLEIIFDEPPVGWLKELEMRVMGYTLLGATSRNSNLLTKAGAWMADYLQRNEMEKLSRYYPRKVYLGPKYDYGLEVTYHREGGFQFREGGEFPLTLQAWWVRVSYLLGGVAFDDVDGAFEGD